MYKCDSSDKTIIGNYINIWVNLIEEYDLVKAKKHPIFKFANDFYVYHKICRQNFRKFYVRFKESGNLESFLPQKRGPKWKTRRASVEVENEVLEMRKDKMNRYEIHRALKLKLKDLAPSPSGIYNILKRHNKNRLKEKMKEPVKKIETENPGDLGHADCYHLPKGIIKELKTKSYLIAIVDGCSRIAWCEYLDDVTSLSAMFGIMRCFKAFTVCYEIKFIKMMTDNGAEFGGNAKKEPEKITNPVKRLFYELDIKHIHTKPYRPQTNGKVERFWRTLKADLLDDYIFETVDEFKSELFQYMIYYNEGKPHQGINGKTPKEYLDMLKK